MVKTSHFSRWPRKREPPDVDYTALMAMSNLCPSTCLCYVSRGTRVPLTLKISVVYSPKAMKSSEAAYFQ